MKAQAQDQQLDYRPRPGDAVDCLLVVIDDELREQGYAPLMSQPYSDVLEEAATESLWMDDQTLAGAARSAIDRMRHLLVQ